MSCKFYIGEPLELLGLPVVGHPDPLNLAKLSESISNVVLLEVVRQALHEQSQAVSRNTFNFSLYNEKSVYYWVILTCLSNIISGLRALGLFDVKVATS